MDLCFLTLLDEKVSSVRALFTPNYAAEEEQAMNQGEHTMLYVQRTII